MHRRLGIEARGLQIMHFRAFKVAFHKECSAEMIMRFGVVRVVFECSLKFRDRLIHLAVPEKEHRVFIMNPPGFRRQPRGGCVFGAGFVFLAEAFQNASIFGMNFAVARIAAQSFLQFGASFTQLRLRGQNLAKAKMHFLLIRIEMERNAVLLCCVIETIRVVQAKAILPMGAGTIRQIGRDPCFSFHFRRFAPRLPNPKRTEWNHKYRYPF